MTRLEDLWQELRRRMRDTPVDHEGFRMLLVDPAAAYEMYAGLEAESRALLAIRVSVRPPVVDLESSAIDCFRLHRADGSWLLVLRLNQPVLVTVFGRLCQDLMDTGQGVGSEQELLDLCLSRLELWRQLFLRFNDGFLPAHEVKGLIGELIVLESLLDEGFRLPPEILEGWRGPLGGDQDFLFDDSAVEVKSVRPGAEEISISSLKQLDPAVPMRVRVLELRGAGAGEDGALSLNGAAQRIEAKLSADPATLAVYRTRLLAAGYVEHEHYDGIIFRQVSSRTYRVDGTFPRLVPDSVPAGIKAAVYRISLDSIERHREVSGADHG